MKIAVGIATYRRKKVLSETLSLLNKQTRKPDRILIAATTPDDVDPEVLQQVGGELTITKEGLCRQRNGILSQLEDEDVILFFDDDFSPAEDYLEQVEKLFEESESIVVATGELIADDILGPGYSFEQSMQFLNEADRSKLNPAVRPVHNAYGCNMALHARLIREHNLRFDEKLAIYGWLEDVDFSRQLKPFGRIVETGLLTGVHRGVKLGRASGKRLGFAQIVNPAYIARKGTCSWGFALTQMSRNFLRNMAGLILPDKLVDRPGRFYGNLIGLSYLVRGKIQPEEILKL